jgi:8-hydroxy-5-deazaflavin:NADPH oxidoreductase
MHLQLGARQPHQLRVGISHEAREVRDPEPLPHCCYLRLAVRCPEWNAAGVDFTSACPIRNSKMVIDAINSFATPPEELDGLLSSQFVARTLTGARLVKGFNHLAAATLAADPVVEGGHRVVFLLSDDEEAIAPVEALAKQLGFAPVKLGKLHEGGSLVHARGRTWGQLIFEDLFKKEQ